MWPYSTIGRNKVYLPPSAEETNGKLDLCLVSKRVLRGCVIYVPSPEHAALRLACCTVLL